jgi:hypothetical protein
VCAHVGAPRVRRNVAAGTRTHRRWGSWRVGRRWTGRGGSGGLARAVRFEGLLGERRFRHARCRRHGRHRSIVLGRWYRWSRRHLDPQLRFLPAWCLRTVRSHRVRCPTPFLGGRLAQLLVSRIQMELWIGIILNWPWASMPMPKLA